MYSTLANFIKTTTVEYMEEIEYADFSEMEEITARVDQLESGAPLEPDRPLEYSRHVRRQ